jgi:uncharacterized membrane protein YhaH (DUF805 family)
MENRNILQYFFDCVTINYANFRGRSRRKEYWSLILFTFIIFILFLTIGDLFEGQYQQYFFGFFFIAFFLPVLSAGVRRMHDIGKSGTTLLVYFIPVIGGIWLLVLLSTDSQKGANKHGPNPKNPIIENELDLIGSE